MDILEKDGKKVEKNHKDLQITPTNTINKYDKEMQKKLTNTIAEKLRCSSMEPIVSLSNEQEDHLKEGDGQKRNREEYKQVNSSTGLAVNFFKIMESQGAIENVIFEEKVAKPVTKGGRYANLDVKYNKVGDNTLYFVESKFLEPYYSCNKNNDAYVGDENAKKYETIVGIENSKKWEVLFEKANAYKFYNASQLCTHLLAIYRWMKESGEPQNGYKSVYKNEQVVLQSIIWEMPTAFLEQIDCSRCKMNLETRIQKIIEEEENCNELINKHISEIKWGNMRFETLKYNDEVEKIKGSEWYDEFCRRYFLK